ncbi:uncharacterized protein [Argopecten irradians]|uniref:uncharacterized protein n=1 Tax=Argopecten irradians TaxID=31199 RepID=UPI0037140B51
MENWRKFDDHDSFSGYHKHIYGVTPLYPVSGSYAQVMVPVKNCVPMMVKNCVPKTGMKKTSSYRQHAATGNSPASKSYVQPRLYSMEQLNNRASQRTDPIHHPCHKPTIMYKTQYPHNTAGLPCNESHYETSDKVQSRSIPNTKVSDNIERWNDEAVSHRNGKVKPRKSFRPFNVISNLISKAKTRQTKEGKNNLKKENVQDRNCRLLHSSDIKVLSPAFDGREKISKVQTVHQLSPNGHYKAARLDEYNLDVKDGQICLKEETTGHSGGQPQWTSEELSDHWSPQGIYRSQESLRYKSHVSRYFQKGSSHVRSKGSRLESLWSMQLTDQGCRENSESQKCQVQNTLYHDGILKNLRSVVTNGHTPDCGQSKLGSSSTKSVPFSERLHELPVQKNYVMNKFLSDVHHISNVRFQQSNRGQGKQHIDSPGSMPFHIKFTSFGKVSLMPLIWDLLVKGFTLRKNTSLFSYFRYFCRSFNKFASEHSTYSLEKNPSYVSTKRITLVYYMIDR